MVIEVLTKDDVNDLITQRLTENNIDLLTKFAQSVRSIVREEVDASLKKEIAPLRAEIGLVKTEIASIKPEIASIKTEIATLRTDVKKEFELNNRKLEDIIGKVMEKKLKNAHLVLS